MTAVYTRHMAQFIEIDEGYEQTSKIDYNITRATLEQTLKCGVFDCDHSVEWIVDDREGNVFHPRISPTDYGIPHEAVSEMTSGTTVACRWIPSQLRLEYINRITILGE